MESVVCYNVVGFHQKDIWFAQGGCKMEYLALVIIGVAVVVFGYFSLQQAEEVDEKTPDEVMHESANKE